MCKEDGALKKVRLNGTDLSVSSIGMGCANLGTPKVPEGQAHEQIDMFLELGGNLLDTAHVYSDWIPGEKNRSEHVIGRWLDSHPREKIILCTKGAHPDLEHPSVSRVTPDDIRRDLSESLDCLHTDHVDIYMLHRDNPSMKVGPIMDCLAGFVEDGRVRYLACSNWTAERHAEANAYAAAHDLPRFSVNELMWSMAEINRTALPRDYVAMDTDMMDFGRREGISFFCFSSLAKGYFTRRYLGLPIHDAAVYSGKANDRMSEKLKGLPSAADVTRESLRWFASREVPAIPLVSFSNADQQMECCSAFAE